MRAQCIPETWIQDQSNTNLGENCVLAFSKVFLCEIMLFLPVISSNVCIYKKLRMQCVDGEAVKTHLLL